MHSTNKVIVTILLLSILSSAFFGIHAVAQERIKVVIDDKEIAFDVDPIVIQDRTMVPFRKIFELFGFKVDWSEATETVLANRGEQTIVLQINNTKAFVNNKASMMDVPAQVINDRTMVPLRFVSENIGASVEWIESTNTVKITAATAMN